MINLKKTTAVILAAIMTMTMGITAFADENNESTSSGSAFRKNLPHTIPKP